MLFSQRLLHPVQLSGLVVSGDSSYGIPSVYLYVPRTSRGTITDYYGFFSLPVLPGDTLIISSAGFVNNRYIVSPDALGKLSKVFELGMDTTYLPEVEIFPYYSVELFKYAFVNLKMTPTGNFYDEKLFVKANTYHLQDRQFNQIHDLQSQMQAEQNKSQAPTTNYLNPFAWRRFVKSLKKDD